MNVTVPILTPGGDQVSHAVDQGGGVRLDDDLRDEVPPPDIADGDHFCEGVQGVEGCVEFGALTGQALFSDLEGLVVVRVDVEEDTASCDSVWATLVATNPVGGNDDCVTMGVQV